jgi:NADH-quinone oxidoreductase subunit N
MTTTLLQDLSAVGPELILVATILVVLCADLWRMGRDRASVWVLAPIVTILTGYGLFAASSALGGVNVMPEFAGLVLVYAVVTIADLWYRGRDEWVPGVLVLIGTALAGYRLYEQAQSGFFGFDVPGVETEALVLARWGELLRVDAFGIVLRALALLSLFVTALQATFYQPFRGSMAHRGVHEYLSCLVTAHVGGMLLVQAHHLLFVFLALETLSLTSYLQAGMLKGDRRSGEAGIKYIVYGSVASGMLLFGFSLLYALTGEMTVTGVMEGLKAIHASEGPESLIGTLAVLGTLGGLAYKLAVVPFHFWAPDVYEGSPTPTTAFLSVGSKAVSFGILIRFFAPLAGDVEWTSKLVGFFAFLAAITMTYGNLAALRQSNLKRLLAFSSIAHAGYLLMGIVALYRFGSGDAAGSSTLSSDGSASILFYLLAYALMNLGAFGVVIYLANRSRSEEIEDLRGLGWKAPIACGALIVFLLSLTGIPPTAGFWGKYYLLVAVIDAGYLWLAMFAVLNTVISLFYYFRIAKSLFLKGEDEALFETEQSWPLAACVVALAAITLWIGVFPQSALELATGAANTLSTLPG